MSEVCPGRCNNRYRRAQAAYAAALDAWLAAEEQHATRVAKWEALKRRDGVDQAGPRPKAEHGSRPDPPSIMPSYGEPIWCRGCAAELRVTLGALDELMPLRLRDGDGYGTPADFSAGGVSRSPEPLSPSPALDDLEELLEWLRAWENAFRETQRWLAAPYRGMSASALTTAVAWLGEHLDRMLAHPDISEPFGTGLQWWLRRLEKVTRTRPPLRKKPIPCRRCGRRSLFFHDDPKRATVQCHADTDRCGLIMTVGEYDDYQDEYERDQGQATARRS